LSTVSRHSGRRFLFAIGAAWLPVFFPIIGCRRQSSPGDGRLAEGKTDVTLRMQNMVVMLTNRFDIGIIDPVPAPGALIGILHVA